MKERIQGALLLVLFAMFITPLILTDRALSEVACNYYASPTGTGNGLTQSTPFRIANFWSVAKPGDVLCLLDGTYTGSQSMINPHQNLRGISGRPITIRALNDGKVLINGQGARIPLMLYLNDWFVVEGVNACCSNGTVVHLGGASNNVIRRVAAWDAADGNNFIFGIHGGEYNLLEDVAGWGIARKILSSGSEGNFTTVRRAWGRWEGSHVVGPKSVYEFVYNNRGMIVENAIGTWSGERMRERYVLLDYSGQPWTGAGAGTYTDYAVDQPYGIFSVAGLPDARVKLLGSVAYIRATDRFQPGQLVFVTKVDGVEVNNTVAFIQPGSYMSLWPFGLFNLATGVATNLRARNLTSIGGDGSYFDSDWQKSNILEGSNLGVYKPGENIFSTNRGANLCYRYQDGVLTNQPLWPWPMNQRIIDATVASGRAQVDVTATIEAMFGSIPAACKTNTTSDGGPSAPTNLQVQP